VKYWLFKTEPDVFGIDDLKQQKTASWEGVRNYQARNFLRQCAVGDEVFIYHSSCKLIGIAGIGKIVRTAYPDETQFDPGNSAYDADSKMDNPRWSTVDVAFVKKFSTVIPLQKLKEHPGLQEMILVQKGSRLSVMPVTAGEWKIIMAMAD
jgi:predicted RNA-binding protein with PUA-like domain